MGLRVWWCGTTRLSLQSRRPSVMCVTRPPKTSGRLLVCVSKSDNAKQARSTILVTLRWTIRCPQVPSAAQWFRAWLVRARELLTLGAEQQTTWCSGQRELERVGACDGAMACLAHLLFPSMKALYHVLLLSRRLCKSAHVCVSARSHARMPACPIALYVWQDSIRGQPYALCGASPGLELRVRSRARVPHAAIELPTACGLTPSRRL
jgi:hypothetical protein